MTAEPVEVNIGGSLYTLAAIQTDSNGRVVGYVPLGQDARFGAEPRDDDEVGRWVVTVAVPADADLPNASAIEAAVQTILPVGFVVEVEVEA